MTSSLTTALEEMNEQLRRENDVLKTDVTQLRTNNDAMKDENKQLTTLLDKMAVNNQNQIQQINSLSNDYAQLQTVVQQLKVSQCRDHMGSSHTLFSYTIQTTHTFNHTIVI